MCFCSLNKSRSPFLYRHVKIIIHRCDPNNARANKSSAKHIAAPMETSMWTNVRSNVIHVVCSDAHMVCSNAHIKARLNCPSLQAFTCHEYT